MAQALKDATSGVLNAVKRLPGILQGQDGLRGRLGDGEEVKGESIRWLAIFIGLTVFFYNMAVPLISRKKSVYSDLRLGILL